MTRIVASLLVCAISSVAPLTVSAVTIPTVPVENAGNIADTEVMTDGTTGYGSVAYNYRIGTTEVTNTQYAEFLNAKAVSDPLGLYNTAMGFGTGGIARGGSSGSYGYAAISGRGDKPVNWVSWYDTIRFANWLHNGQGSGDTETGAYTLLGGTPTPSNGDSITRNSGATWFLASENEWYKAAYYDPSGDSYFDFPTSSDSVPIAEPPPGGSNSANYDDVVGDLTDVGAYTLSGSPSGTFDQMGILQEWIEIALSLKLDENNVFVPQAAVGTFRAVNGGQPGLFMQRDSKGATMDYADVGFRVGTVPEPSTAVLAIIGLVSLAIAGWRRKR